MSKTQNFKGKSKGKRNCGPEESKETRYRTNRASREMAKDSISGVTHRNPQPYDSITSNDIKYYNKSVNYYRDAVKVPFNIIEGAPLDKRFVSGTHGTKIEFTAHDAAAMPGVLAIDFIPSVGTCDSRNDPLNRAFTSIYTEMYSKTSGTLNITQASVAMFCVCMANISNFVAAAKRGLAIARMYSKVNYYWPRGLWAACGFSDQLETFVTNIDHYRMRLNQLILNFNGLNVPNFIDTFERQYSLCHNVWRDEDSVRAQMYLFRPAGYFKYDDVNNKAKYYPLNWDSGVSFTNLLDAIEDMIEAWRHSSDLGYINGALMRAFSDAQFVSLDYVGEYDTIQPVYDRNMMWQINNLVTLDGLLPIPDITEDVVGDALYWKPSLAPESSFYSAEQYCNFRDKWLLNSYDGTIDDEFVMEATRLIPWVDSNSYVWCGPELVTQFTIYAAWLDPNTGKTEYTPTRPYYSYLDIRGNEKLFGHDMLNLEKFKCAPRVTVGYQSTASFGPTSKFEVMGETGDIYRYTYLDQPAWRGLLTAALQSLYWVENYEAK